MNRTQPFIDSHQRLDRGLGRDRQDIEDQLEEYERDYLNQTSPSLNDNTSQRRKTRMRKGGTGQSIQSLSKILN